VRTVQDTAERNETVARRWETLQVSLLLLTLLAIFFWKAVFLGRKLVPEDLAYNDAFYLEYRPAGFTQPHNALLYDQAYQFYPGRVYVLEALQQGFLPFWNPYLYCGAPFMAEEEPAVFYPLNIVSYVLPAADTFLFTAAARLFVAGLATYWFVRTMGRGKFGALLSSISFAFSGFMVVWLSHQHTNVAAWLPAMFLTVEWLHRKPSAQHIAWVALVIAAQLTGGRTELCLYTLTVAGVYFLFRVGCTWWSDRQQRPAVTRMLSFSMAAVLGFALAAIQLLPFWQWLQGSAIFHSRMASQNLPATPVGLKYWLSSIPVMLLPNVFGNPTWPGTYRSFLPGRNYPEMTLYVGVIALSLAMVVTIVRRRDQLVLFFAGLGLTTLGAALRWPVFEMVNKLPLFNISSAGRFRVIYCFCISVLAGLGAQYLLDAAGKSSIVRATVRVLGGLAALGVFVLLLVRRWLGAAAADATATQTRTVSESILRRAFSVSNVRIYWPVLVAVAGILLFTLYVRRVLSQKTMQAAVLLLVVMDMFAFGMDYHTTVRAETIFPETLALRLIKSDEALFRVVGTNTDFMPGTGIAHGLYDVRGLVFPESRYRELCRAMGGQDWVGIGILFTEELPSRLLNLLNVKYVLTSSSLNPELLENMALAGTDGGIRVYQNLSCLPRAFVVNRVRIAQDDQEILEIMQSPGFDMSAEIVLEESPPAALIASAGSAPQTSAEITRYDPNRVTILASTAQDGFLFLSDSYDGGWKAYVDDVEVELYRADYAFRAVYLTAGQHKVDFAYTPRSFGLGLLVTLGALLGLILLLASSRLRTHRAPVIGNATRPKSPTQEVPYGRP